MTDDLVDDAGEVEETDPDRSSLLKKMLVGAAFAAPLVSSFSMDGLSVAGAGTVVGESVGYGGYWRSSDAKFANLFGGYGWLAPYSGGASLTQDTGSPWQSRVAAGAVGVRFSFDVLQGSVNYFLTMPGETLTPSPSGSAGGGHFTADYTITGGPTAAQRGVFVSFTNAAAPGVLTEFDNVTVQGIFPPPEDA